MIFLEADLTGIHFENVNVVVTHCDTSHSILLDKHALLNKNMYC